jgi:ParB family chromosome partitioning protein
MAATTKKAAPKKSAAKKSAPKKATKKASPKKPAAKKASPKKKETAQPPAKEARVLSEGEIALAPDGDSLASFEVPIEEIVLPDYWNREKLGDISHLVSSLKERGQLIPLLTNRVIVDGKEKHLLVDGRRRYAALQEARISKAIVFSIPSEDTVLDAIIANLNRQQNTPWEQAVVFKTLREKGRTVEHIAKSCGVTAGSVSHYLRLFDLEEDVQSAFKRGVLTISHIREFARVSGEPFTKFRAKLLNQIEAKSLSPTAVKERIDQELQTRGEPKKSKGGRKPKVPLYTPLNFEAPEIRSKIAPKPADEVVNYYSSAASRLQGMRPSSSSAKYLEGFLKGVEVSLGVTDKEPF